MSWGTYYIKTHGYASHQSAAGAVSESASREEWLNRLWQRILILMSASPHGTKDEEGHLIEWVDYIQREFANIKDEMEEYYFDLHQLNDVAEAYEEGYVVITYCKNGHAHFRSVKYSDHECKTCCDCGAEIVGCCRMNVCREG